MYTFSPMTAVYLFLSQLWCNNNNKLALSIIFHTVEDEILIKEAQRLKHLYKQQQMQQHSSLQPSHMHQLPTSLDFDLQQLQFSKLSLGTMKPVDSKLSPSNGVFRVVKYTTGNVCNG